ncbi:phage holin family protein [Calothrix sp. CCY 0018]|uniref:phage holin family protein n=1 Tax=Calothrix sp. CCY 0018 TaxID=3103864 RepID=UPI0039C6438A
MLSIFLTTLATALSLLIVDVVVPGVNLANFPSAMIAGLVIGLVNGSIKPIISTLSLPINLVTLGAFSLVVNGLCFWLAAVITPGFSVHGLIAFFLAPVVMSFGNTFISNYMGEKNLLAGKANNNAELPSN